MTDNIRVLAIDDSPLMRRLLSEIFKGALHFELVGAAQDAAAARGLIRETRPDVITLDNKMPDMDGLTFLAEIVESHYIPVVMVSYFTQEGAEEALSALEIGAVDFVGKPIGSTDEGWGPFRQILLERVRAAAGAQRVRSSSAPRTPHPSPQLMHDSETIIAIGSSTGGTEALMEIFRVLPAGLPGIVVVQHMPENLTDFFAQNLNRVSPMEIKEARDGDEVCPGRALIARGNNHMAIRGDGNKYRIETHQGPKVWNCRPAVDVLFDSVASVAREKAIGVILTGMGEDGAIGLTHMNKNGARTIVQNKESCVVFGMPKKAIELGAAEFILPLQDIP
ncbi:MAG TPA: chemotaxis response regulator protein-glutamate methylesterase [Nitrospinae bacterium]|nr:chemotaxis response regulator protein-glutamate methylesterase [Nitrospinota bacterium]